MGKRAGGRLFTGLDDWQFTSLGHRLFTGGDDRNRRTLRLWRPDGLRLGPSMRRVDATPVLVQIEMRQVVGLDDVLITTVRVESQPELPREIDGVRKNSGAMGPAGGRRAICGPVNVHRLSLQQAGGLLQGGFPWHQEADVGGIKGISRSAATREDEGS